MNDEFNRVEDFIGLGVPKGKPFSTQMVVGRQALERCLGYFERRRDVDETQKWLLGLEGLKWSAVIIEGYCLLSENLKLFYILVPVVTLLGVETGSGHLVLCRSDDESEAEKMVSFILASVKARIKSRQWSDIQES